MTGMAQFGCASMHKQLLRSEWRTTSKTAVGVYGSGMQQQQQPTGCLRSYGMRVGANRGVRSATPMFQARKSNTMRMGMTEKVVSSDFAKTRDDSGSSDNTAGFTDKTHITEVGKEEESVVAAGHGNLWGVELETLVHGQVGRCAVLAILLMGVGVSCFTNAGDAEASTTHIRSSGALGVDMKALALGPEGPLLEEFWDNMRRYGLYFLTVVTGGVYQLVKPAVDALRNPLTAVLVIVIVTGSLYLVSLTVSAMLGINQFAYDYAS